MVVVVVSHCGVFGIIVIRILFNHVSGKPVKLGNSNTVWIQSNNENDKDPLDVVGNRRNNF